MNIPQIFKNNQDWIGRKKEKDPEFFKKLSMDQKPDVLYIGCSDSRITAEKILGAKLGEVFVHRNIANMVPNSDINVMSVIDYAVTLLKVSHIIVCGHYNCGGIKAAMESKDLGILNPWLRNIRDVYRLHKEELDNIEDQEAKYRRLVEVNVEEQCFNVIKTAEVQRAFLERDITVHGWVFNIHNGELINLNIDFKKKLEDVREIYHLD